MARPVLLALPFLPVHHRELVGLVKLLEHPDDPHGPPGVLTVIDTHHRCTIVLGGTSAPPDTKRSTGEPLPAGQALSPRPRAAASTCSARAPVKILPFPGDW